ncbi:YlmC/YmxH family sporulation protein [Clostridium oryzae]|uniref:PRC-barrel domain protein n=1 Tax=Clostridium oryzae TaxID=1450648 RepID=A0A1V4IHE1_9CLOT|nr:YlmC/YmxH family sporulation protein [Clostridium oryzae]OPJ59095.1 PRC-barrel domain protein [Clostridium oryzae]
MQYSMYSINNIRMMEVIDINSGSKMGYIKDMKVDCEKYKIISVIIPIHKASWLSKVEAIEIPWENVKKIGVDVILVDAGNMDNKLPDA